MLTTRMNIVVSVLLVCAFLIGCGNLKAVGKFADGAQMLSEASGKFYESELETDRKLAIMLVDLENKESKLKKEARESECKNSDGTYITSWDCATKGKNLMSEARRHRAAVASLAQYAQTLKELAEFNDDQNVEKSAKELSGNLSAFAKTLDAAASVDESALATAITKLAEIYIDLRVRNAIHEKAKLAQNHVSLIVKTLKNDIAQQQKRLKIYRVDAMATREEWFKTFEKQYRANQALLSSKKTSASEQSRLEYENSNLTIVASTLVGDELNDQLAEQPGILFLSTLDKAANSCLEAHQAIQNPDIKETSGYVVKFFNDAKTLLSSVKQLSK